MKHGDNKGVCGYWHAREYMHKRKTAHKAKPSSA